MKRQFLALAALSAIAFGANAQQADGNIMGIAKAGDSIEIKAPETGVHREITVETDGKYQFRRVPLGTYVVTVKHADGQTEQPKQVRVVVGATARVQ
ncbi:carboxypeptidase-like regulatory domain-containing protein [Lysobacter sp. KIS68-7]|uniref:carboxypeptidase-like regulatory domain-containing protein n=1 Tax=Lysobacter sp. KIS68-7 TaxID=2904252 RepID=UPI001E4EF79D|nr:carboxypeptidase-like regulatory domain-containing protein [Lysobacter sp. KIS68-7]UHQ20700.1 carboxypeptidase-like regulatory domain-containing protein [Lysobacter sp. KIS68-7]